METLCHSLIASYDEYKKGAKGDARWDREAGEKPRLVKAISSDKGLLAEGFKSLLQTLLSLFELSLGFSRSPYLAS
jgi:hypothetical protein